MVLIFRVVGHEDKTRYTNGLYRITLRCDQADAIQANLTIAVEDVTLYPLGSLIAFRSELIEA